MKNKKAKLLMKGRVKSRFNGEVYVVTKVSIRGCDLVNGPVLVYSDFVGEFEEAEMIASCLIK
ncbi:hypothetical protein NVP1087A_15 [Vibrio phage 1.087.A._10N.261.45.F9]|nr:hypothetical protein NVP1087A_15 [Vibrio phage 1.087.A._10N.261.45.F9]